MTVHDGSPVLVQPCPPHQWGHAPTVGYFECVRCRERINYDDPRYAEMTRSTGTVHDDDAGWLKSKIGWRFRIYLNRDDQLRIERIASRLEGLRK